MRENRSLTHNPKCVPEEPYRILSDTVRNLTVELTEEEICKMREELPMLVRDIQ